MSFADELKELSQNPQPIIKSNSIYDKRENYLNKILQKCKGAASGGAQFCEGYFCFDSKDDRKCIYEYLKYEFSNKEKYGFKNIQIKEYDSTEETAFYQIKYYFSWLEKKPLTTPSDFTERVNRPLQELESQIDNYELKRAYKKERKEQFIKMHPNWKWIKPLLIILAIILLFILFP